MFLVIVTLLILAIVIISYIRLVYGLRDYKLLVMNEKTEIMLMVKKTEIMTSKVLDVMQRIVEQQNVLDDKMTALAIFVDKHSTNIAMQQEQFNVLAKSDMLSARREELLRTKELKIALERLMGVALTSRQPAAPNDVLALENLTKRIEELESIIERGDV